MVSNTFDIYFQIQGSFLRLLTTLENAQISQLLEFNRMAIKRASEGTNSQHLGKTCFWQNDAPRTSETEESASHHVATMERSFNHAKRYWRQNSWGSPNPSTHKDPDPRPTLKVTFLNWFKGFCYKLSISMLISKTSNNTLKCLNILAS